jgi:beta-glucosidase
MSFQTTAVALCTICLSATVCVAQALRPAAVDKQIDAQVNTWMAELTAEEKIDLIGAGSSFGTKAIPRLGIPAVSMSDGPVGARNVSPSIAYAGGIGLAATWDTDMARQVGEQLARDAKSRGAGFLLGPGVNIYRAPMNGRNFEYFGEDPFLASEIAVAYIEGVQSQGVVSTVKHFLGNNSEFARTTSDSIIGERTLREIYLPVFEAAVKQAHVGAIMDSYNLTNGTYMTANGYFNTEIAKKQWGFQGIVMSDWGAAHDGVTDANGGLDLEMPSPRNMNRTNLLAAIAAGTVQQSSIDDKVRRLLRLIALYHLGDDNSVDSNVSRYNQQGRQVSYHSAQEGMVLLKNEGHLLPIDKQAVHTILVVGPDAHPAFSTGGGSGNVSSFASISYLQGISDAALDNPDVNVLYARGIPPLAQLANFTNFTTEAGGGAAGITRETFTAGPDFKPEDFATAKPTTAVIERHINVPRVANVNQDGSEQNPADTMTLGPPVPRGPVLATRYTGYFTPASAGLHDIFVQYGGPFRLLIDGAIVIDNLVIPRAVVNQATLHLSATPHKVVFEIMPGMGFGRQAETRLGIALEGTSVDASAKAMAAAADLVVVAVGFNADLETEGADREFQLPPAQNELIRQMAAANKHTLVVVTSGGSVDASSWIDQVPALIEAWYPGEKGGAALADILFGAVDPSGRLPITWEGSLKDNPSAATYYYTQPGTNKIEYKEGIFTGYRGYRHSGVKPLFPFGFGLSYTSFGYSDLLVKPSGAPGNYTASFTVTNTGDRAGADVAQLYISDTHAPGPRPAEELKGSARVVLKPGESRTQTITLTPRAFTYFDVEHKLWHADPGVFTVLVGRSSEDIVLRQTITLSQPLTLTLDQ